jgi:hypothetical protein
MNHRSRWLAAFVIVAVVIAIAWTMRRANSSADRTPVATSAKHDTASHDAAAPSAEAKTSTRASQTKPLTVPAHAPLDPRMPLGEAVQTLRAWAEAGDTDAAIELSWRLSPCTEHALKVAEQSEQADRRLLEDEKKDESVTPEQHAVRIMNVQGRIGEYERQRDACSAQPADVRTSWLEWIDWAAQAGNTSAMRGYARMATGEYYDANDVRADPDTAIERRDKSRAYLDEAVRRGDAEALRDIAKAYSDSGHPTIYPIDPAQAYAYAYAGTLAGISRGNDLDDTMAEAARSLDGAKLAEAEASGRRIYEKCCAKH